jgi:hypothetical protein
MSAVRWRIKRSLHGRRGHIANELTGSICDVGFAVAAVEADGGVS